MGLYRAPARATIASMSANPSPLSSLTSPGGGVMPQGEEVASFATYPEAQRAVDALSDQGFPVQHLAIIGTDLRQVERITGRMSWGRAAMSGAMSGLWIGMFFGIIMSVAGSSGPRLSFWACVLLGVLWGIIFQLFGYALTRGRRDFTSISQVVASRYSIIAAREVREAAQALAVTLIDDGADMILLAGTTGEAPTTHLPEKQTLLREVGDAIGGRAMLVAGAGSNDTAHAVRIGVGSQQAGAQGLLINAPYYNRPSAEGVYRHIMAVVEATDLPVMVYDIPGRTGVRITDDTLARLAEHERVLAVKDATGDVEQAFRRMEATGLAYYSGDDGLNFAFLAHGASGVVSVVAHADAHSWREMITEVDAGDLPGARAVAQRMRPLVAAMMGGGQGAVMAKEALLLQGRIPSAAVRLPLVRAEADEVAALRKVLAGLGLL